ncbi:Putative ribonuclease H protein At1g65750 [Linum perenne]
MQTSVLPATTCEAIDKIIRDFVWGSTEEQRKTHLIAWERVCLPKDAGGLSLKLSRLLNRAYMTKLAFGFFKYSDKLWVRVLQAKYFRETDHGLVLCSFSSQSAIWKGLAREWQVILCGARSAIRNGRDTLMWTARWVDSGDQLIDWMRDDASTPDIDERVVEYVDSDEQNKGDDQWVWGGGGERDGKFSIKSAYNLICDLPTVPDPDPWEVLWKWKGPNRIRCFLWLAASNRLLTNAQRHRRNMTQDASCPLCNHSDESVTHVLRDCSFAREVWTRLAVFDTADPLWTSDTAAWVFHHLRSGNGLIFGVTCWQLWKLRNERIFTDSHTPVAAATIKIGNWICSIKTAMEREISLMGNGRLREVVELAWDPGPTGWMVLNTDGSVSSDRRRATAGGLLRDAEGRCTLAYTMNLGYCSITRAEMRGALRGLKLAWDT